MHAISAISADFAALRDHPAPDRATRRLAASRKLADFSHLLIEAVAMGLSDAWTLCPIKKAGAQPA
jgi:hypothetical protein